MTKISTAEVAAGTEDFEQEIQLLWTERTGLEKRLSGLELEIASLVSQSPDLKQKLARGDKSASAELDRLDAKAKELTREADGVRMTIQKLQGQIDPLQRQLNEHRKLLAEAERARQFKELCDRAADRTQKLIAQHAEACKTLGELRTTMFELSERFAPDGALSEIQRLVLKPLANPNVALLNAGWKEAVGLYRETLEIRGLVPPPGYHSRKI